jgi:hypothetical protein
LDSAKLREIESYGIRRSHFARYRGWLVLAGTAITAIGMIFYWPQSSGGPNGAQVATAFITAVALALAYQQWRAARNEISLDRYYDRLEIANRRLDAWPAARYMVAHFWQTDKDDDTYHRSMYVFTELDNLEYVIEKYKVGFIKEEQLLRGLRCFRSRSVSVKFRELALVQVHGSGYQETTQEVVSHICRESKQSGLTAS